MKYVYFIKPVGMDGPIKIGCSNYPEQRLIWLSTWSPLPLEIITTTPGDIKLERNIHCCFADLHSHREWFRAEPRLIEAIELIKQGTPIGEAIDLRNRVGGIVKRKSVTSRQWSDIDRQKMSVLHRVRYALEKIGVHNHYIAPAAVKAAMIASGYRLLSESEADVIKSFSENPYPYAGECMAEYVAWKQRYDARSVQ